MDKNTSSTTELKNAGLKVTIPRLKILELFLHAETRHVSADEVYRTLIDNDIEIGIATVYRVLTQFVEAGILLRHNFDNEHSVYELEHGNHHDHLLCTKCGKVEEFLSEEIEQIQRDIAKAKQFDMTDHTLVIYGICKQCCKTIK
jgi:Fur family transcriptional regulator, ferric uptake regulator